MVVVDNVQCFDCGVRLKNWEPEDNVWKDHSYWSPDCVYTGMVQVL